MNESKISVRYAKSLFLTAKEKDLLDVIKTDVELIFSVGTTLADMKMLLHSPVLKTSEKQKILKSVFEGKIHKLSLSFIALVTQNKRERFLVDMARNFLALYRKNKGIKKAIFTSAEKIAAPTLSKLKTIIKESYKSEIDLSNELNKDLIGGFVLRVEDQQIDASVSGKLKKMKQQLTNIQLKKQRT